MVIGRLITMKGNENVYIQKDLTYRQRQELSEKRFKTRLSTVLIHVIKSFGNW